MFKLLFFLLLQTPASLQPPPGQKLLFKLQGKGNQIYVCQNAVWVFKAPAARLFDDKGQLAGKHFAGPTWEANDGSQVKGKVSATVASPDKQSVPWLLVTAVSHQGTGIMAAVETIQRLETQGGKAPAASCDPVMEKKETPVPYEANYYFYGLR